MVQLGNELKQQSTDLGKLTAYTCDAQTTTIECDFEYDLAEDYCWYGYFQASATYVIDNHGALELIDHQINWSN